MDDNKLLDMYFARDESAIRLTQERYGAYCFTVANNILFRQAILNKASELVLVHNHPSGNPMPSTMDIETTRDLVRCGHLLGIPILDHIIIGKPSSNREKDFVSLRNLGYIRD